MKKPHPLDDLEMHELLRLLYPDHIRSDDDAYFELSQQACDAMVDLGDGFEVPLPELLARVAMLTMPMQSGLTGALSHCLGEVTIADGTAQMRAAVRRDVGAERRLNATPVRAVAVEGTVMQRNRERKHV